MLRSAICRAKATTGGAKLVGELCRENRKVSVLSNGMRIMSYEDNTAVSGLAFFTRMGARFETAATAGSTSVIDCLLHGGNALRTEQQFAQDLHALGASLRSSQDVREVYGLAVNVPRYNVREGLEFLENAALHLSTSDEAMSAAKSLAIQRSLLQERNATQVCFEMIHRAAFDNVALGRPLWQEPEVIERLTPQIVRDFHARFTQPERSVLVASGIDDHDGLVSLVERIFDFPALPTVCPPISPDHAYTGGLMLKQNDKAPESVTKFAEKNLTHIGLCFKGIQVRHPDYFAYTVIQTLLGGGTSFSSGGPGKGIHTKLFREVICREGWLHGVECVSAWYENAGLLGLYGSAEHDYTTHLLNVMFYQAGTIPARVTARDLDMAKNQLMSQLVLLGEARDLALDESAKLLLQHDMVTLPSDLMRGAESVTLDDLRRVCATMVKEPLTLVVYGNTKPVPDAAKASSLIQALHRKHCS